MRRMEKEAFILWVVFAVWDADAGWRVGKGKEGSTEGFYTTHGLLQDLYERPNGSQCRPPEKWLLVIVPVLMSVISLEHHCAHKAAPENDYGSLTV
jgi:hypothetical protein